ncbi:hypothetical protein CYJ61_04960 [Gardnerella leopoldii]|uniref:Uncharacterized protein n=1 Tax=Gardnerella vaginalis TaxID=2702 RepID=A0AAP8IS56_GARVA|nr:hypothetical protein CYJ61_04960 [Gardnerella vaginalis]
MRAYYLLSCDISSCDHDLIPRLPPDDGDCLSPRFQLLAYSKRWIGSSVAKCHARDYFICTPLAK